MRDRGNKWRHVKDKELAIKSLATAAAAARVHRAQSEHNSNRQSRERTPSRKRVEVVAQAL